MEVPLKYYFENDHEACVIFDKYTFDKNGNVRNKATGEVLRPRTDKKGYQRVDVQDASGKPRSIRIARALASTFLGPPPTQEHTADHKNKNRANDTLANIRWLCKRGQRINQDRLDTKKDAFLVDRDGDEKTANEWADYFESKGEKNPYGREYTSTMIQMYAIRKQHGFLYKKYLDLEGEVWKDVEGSETKKGMWRVSNMNRAKYVTNHAENVLEGERLGLKSGYPKISFNGKDWLLHVVVFMTFFPDKWAKKKPDEMVLHKEDDQMDFRPEMLRLGTQSENAKDAHDNGKYDGTLTARQKCESYIGGVLEKEHESQLDAAEYLRSIGHKKASKGSISEALSGTKKNGSLKVRYGRTWVLV